MDITLLQKANKEARKLKNISVGDFALKNPERWPSEFLRLVLGQYAFLEKLKKKLPKWAENPDILGASLVNIEQSSSGETAEHKFRNESGELAADLTGGFGIDSYFLAQKFKSVHYCEPNTELYTIVKHNFEALGIDNVIYHNCTAEEFLDQNLSGLDLIFLDPDRRSEKSSKLVRIEDCSPNLLEINNTLLNKAAKFLVKYSPLLDIQLAINSLNAVTEVEIIAVKNDVKELIFSLQQTKEPVEISLQCFNFTDTERQQFDFSLQQEKNAQVSFGEPQSFLYEPNAAIMKAGAFKSIANQFNLLKLASNSHFYTSDQLINNFPGKILKIHQIYSANSKELKKLKGEKFNIISRNFPAKPETLKKKYRLIDGGDRFLVFTQNHKNEKIVVSCTRNFDLNT
ncbi:class I SAM-dependent methyltransferase [Jiulongibacter sp. NS-SX5]|uniref:class I SAM-dependent methyltransferase n=1 Tax=Jiulongibacter sp. NS-SX5 TaxID=3463854 RepID=UPI00405973FD